LNAQEVQQQDADESPGLLSLRVTWTPK